MNNNNNTNRWSVWVGGGEVNDYLVTYNEAKLIANNYLDKNYDDVVITLDTTNPQFPFGKKEVLDNE
jgi:hypothetical protein